MSHPGKFVSVNLNRSYGQSAQSQHGGRPSRPAGPSAAGGGGMVVLSRGRGSSSVAKPQQPKLSVPPPLNLPSLRKEHERFDGATATSGGGVASAPARSGGAVAGWTKPAPASEKPLGSAPPPSGVARPPSYGFQEKAAFLRGEDFPSLKAAVAPPPPPPAQHRQKDGDGARAATPETRPMPLGMRPQVLPLRGAEPLASGGSSAGVHASVDKAQKHDLGPLPLVRLRYNSDWADDERDTGLSLPERDTRESGFGRSEPMASGRDVYGAMREPLKNDSFVAATKESGHDGPWRSPMPNHNRERTDGRPYSAGKGGIANGRRRIPPFPRNVVAILNRARRSTPRLQPLTVAVPGSNRARRPRHRPPRYAPHLVVVFPEPKHHRQDFLIGNDHCLQNVIVLPCCQLKQLKGLNGVQRCSLLKRV